ncbi:MAG: DUF4270 domain-containing protein [Sphingobacteriaceae bacterium]|nr:DUF4270 domain-containing protein [Sphingobacteriaceae bacterium]
MKFFKLDLLTLLISLFLFAACKDANQIGLDLDDKDAIKSALIDTLTIKSETLEEEPKSTVGYGRYPMGFLTDPVFGTTQADLAMTVNLPSDAYSFGTSPVLDSAVLVLNYARIVKDNKYETVFYGDSTSNYNIEVYQLNDNPATETSFLSNKVWTKGSQLLGSQSAKIAPNTFSKVMSIITGKKDTLINVNPQIRIKLDKAFIDNAIVKQSAAVLAKNSIFTSNFKGLHVGLKNPTTGTGGLMFFDFAGSNSKLELYYRKTNNTSTTSNIDTVGVSFPISSGSNPIAATIKHDYTGTAIETQLKNTAVQYPITYLQPMAGLRNKISFPNLNELSKKVGKIVVNKAELVVDLSTGSNTGLFKASPRLTLYRYDIAEQRKNIPDNNRYTQSNPGGDARALSESGFGGYFDAINNRYIFVMTSYLQDLIDKKTEDYGTFLGATGLTEFDMMGAFSTGARSIIGSGAKDKSNQLINPTNRIKLNIYYTKVN